MVRFLCFIIVAVLFVACGDNADHTPEIIIEKVRKAVEIGDYDEARMLIDSLRINYPAAIEAREEALKLENSLELKHAKFELASIDSIYQLELTKLDSLRRDFVLEKNEAFQTVGYYVTEEQISSKMHKTSLRAEVNEEGLMLLVSIVHGKRLNHNSIKVTLPTGEYLESGRCFSFLTHTVVGYEEEASFKLGEDGGVIPFIANNDNLPITVTCFGETESYSYKMSQIDKMAIKNCYELSKSFAHVKSLKQFKEKLSLKVGFYEKKISEQ